MTPITQVACHLSVCQTTERVESQIGIKCSSDRDMLCLLWLFFLYSLDTEILSIPGYKVPAIDAPSTTPTARCGHVTTF